MFYNSSEEVFPNWWDALDEATDESKSGASRVMDGGREVDRDGLVLEAAAGETGEDEEHAFDEASDESAENSSEETPDEDNGPHGRDGYQYRIPDFHDPRVREASDASASTLPGLSSGYDPDVVRSVWEFAEVVPGNDPDLWRKDEFGNWIYRLDYGRRTSEFGWEIFDPGVGRHCQGVYAMRPMQWQSFIRQYEAMS